MERYIKNIKTFLPNFKIKNFNILNTGANSVALLVNGEYVFRFLLDKSNIGDYVKEKRFLDVVRPYIKSTKIPELNLCIESETPFTYHKIINGTEYCKIKEPSKNFKEKVAKNIALFCSELHSTNAKLVDFVETKQFDYLGYDLENKKSVLKEILPDYCLKDIDKTLSFLDDYKNYNEGDNVLCHDDLHEENILVDENGLAGIIDFGCVKIRKFDTEFSHLFEYDPELNLMIIKEYENITGRKVDVKYALAVNKIRVYGSLLWFLEIDNEKYIKMFREYALNIGRLE